MRSFTDPKPDLAAAIADGSMRLMPSQYCNGTLLDPSVLGLNRQL